MVTYVLSGPGRITYLGGWLEYVQIRTNTYEYELEDYDYNTITLRLRYDTIRGAAQYNTIRYDTWAGQYDTITYEYVRKKAKDIY